MSTTQLNTQLVSDGASNIVYEPVCQLCDDGHVLLARVHAPPNARTKLGSQLDEGCFVVLKGARSSSDPELAHQTLEAELACMIDVRKFNKENTAEPLDMATNSLNRQPYLVQEYIGSDEHPETLDTWVAGRKAELADTKAVATDLAFLSVFAGIAKGLVDVHKTGRVYADLKGQNVMVAGGKARLVDFGSCQSPNSATHHSSSGTLEYMSPEQFVGQVTKESDAYSLGVCLYEALTDRPPLRAADLRAEEGRLPLKFLDPLKYNVRELNPLVSSDLGSMIHDCLAVLPEMRPSLEKIRSVLLEHIQRYGGSGANTRTAA